MLTDPQDKLAVLADLDVQLVRRNLRSGSAAGDCGWFRETVEQKAMMIQFNRYIEAGDLKEDPRIAALQAEADKHGGYVGLYL